jgi:hypothetical protein
MDAITPAARPTRRAKATASSEARTILVALFRPFSIRMILKSEIFNTLKEASDISLVLLVPNPDMPEIARLADSDRVIIEKFDSARVRELQRGNRFRNFLRTVRLYTYNERAGVPLRTRDVMVYEFRQIQITPRTSIGGRMLIRLSYTLPRLIGRSKFLRRAWRELERLLYARPFHAEIFDRYRPHLLIVSSLGYAGDELLIWQAKRHGVPTLSIVQSWDNTTNKGYPAAEPDAVVAWSDVMRWEISELLDVPADRIFVGGVPHWDNYFVRTRANEKTREVTLRELGLDPTKKTILLSLSSHKMYRHNVDLCRILVRALREGRIEHPAQLLIRPHPAYYERNPKWSAVACAEMSAIQALVREFSDLAAMDSLGIEQFEGGHDIDRAEQERIKVRLLACDVLVNVYSTQAIEAAIFDVPIVNVAFGNYKSTDLPASVEDEFNHYGRIVRSGGVRNVYTETALIEAVKGYLDDPACDGEGRKRIVDQEVPVNRGSAGRVIGRHVISLVEASRNCWQ